MVINKQIDEITQLLSSLPSEKINAVREYVVFLNARYGQSGVVDDQEDWTEEDLHDFAQASARYGEVVAPWDDSPSESAKNDPADGASDGARK